MVPSIIYSRGLWIGWMVRLDGHIRGSVCPFCLSENWDGLKRPQHRSMIQKFAVLLGLIVSVMVLYGILTVIADIAQITTPNNVDMVVQWAIIIGGVLLYRKLRYK